MNIDHFLNLYNNQLKQSKKVLHLTPEEQQKILNTHYYPCKSCNTKFSPKHGEELCGKCRLKIL